MRKTTICIAVPQEIIDAYKIEAEQRYAKYQTLMNVALIRFAESEFKDFQNTANTNDSAHQTVDV